MIKNETLHIRINEKVKKDAEATLDMLGLSISDAVNMFLHQVNFVGGLPFDVKLPPGPESVIVKNKSELYEKLDVGMNQIKNGEVIDANDFMAQLRDKYIF